MFSNQQFMNVDANERLNYNKTIIIILKKHERQTENVGMKGEKERKKKMKRIEKPTHYKCLL